MSKLKEHEILERLAWLNKNYEETGLVLPNWLSEEPTDILMRSWVFGLKAKYKNGKLDDSVMELIKENSECVYLKITEEDKGDWYIKLEKFREYVEEHNKYPNRDEGGKETNLYRWMANNRRFYKTGQLSKSKIKRLNEIHKDLLICKNPVEDMNKVFLEERLKKKAKSKRDSLYGKGIEIEKLRELTENGIWTISDIRSVIKQEAYNREHGVEPTPEHEKQMRVLNIMVGGKRSLHKTSNIPLINKEVQYAVYLEYDRTLMFAGEVELLATVYGGHEVVYQMCSKNNKGTFSEMREIINNAKEKHKHVMMRRYVECASQREVAEELGVSVQYISQIEHTVQNKIRKSIPFIREHRYKSLTANEKEMVDRINRYKTK